MNVFKLLTGLFYFTWMMCSIVLTSPIWMLIFAYDLGSPMDSEDRVMKFFEKVVFLGRI